MLNRMGHRERLLDGAKQALLERGFARTTARDIVAASDTNLASIGYHWGSKDALLTAAMIEAVGEWGDEVERILLASPREDRFEQMEVIWNGAVDSIRRERALWTASVEILTVAERDPALRAQLGEALERARGGLTQMTGGDPADPEQRRGLGSLVLAIMEGLLMQQLIDPERAPSGTDLARAIRSLATETRTA
jgi:AcrR family transcriptional regulator